jgi:hypothetical protein
VKTALALVAVLAAAGACTTRTAPKAPPAPPPPPAILGLDGRPDPRPDAAFVETVRRECAVCHVAPPPADLPRAQWRQRLQDMRRFSLTGVGVPEGKTSGLAQADLEPFASYFEARSPETLPAPAPWPALEAGPLRFERRPMSPPGAAPVPIVANARLVDLDGDGRPEVVACDMGHGLVLAGDPRRSPGELREIAKVPNPARAAAVDLDRDGLTDLLVADIGFFMPEDHNKGAVVWLRQAAGGRWEKRVLVEKLPRVSDVEAFDADGDGDLDLLVSAFGLHSRGSLLLFENRTTDWKEPQLLETVLDSRAGGLETAIADLDGNGRTDFVALFAQQHEEVVAFLNRGGNAFERRTVFAAPTPAWGSTGMQLVDLDRDGDLDVLATNGATLDDATVRPYHGVRWLENRGGYPFVARELAALPGAHRAAAADLDGDGDLDVAAAAFLPDPDRARGGLTSLGWLEQVQPGVFVPHAIEQGQLSHATLDVADADGDGTPDLLAGHFVGFTFARTDTGFRADSWLDLWLNRRPREGNPGSEGMKSPQSRTDDGLEVPDGLAAYLRQPLPTAEPHSVGCAR